MKGPIRFYIQTISPIHVGCDEFYEPTGFVLDENGQQMIVFDPLSFISQMEDADKAEFSQICAKGTIASILEIYKFMQNKTAEGRVVDICPDFLRHYKQTLSLPMRNQREIQQNLNSFAIPRTAFRSVDKRPYIPGSAIKGTLRTAYLNLMEGEKELSKKGKERNARNLEQRLIEYDGIPTDPFRMVKVSDFMPVGETRTRIVYGVNKKKEPSDREARGLPLIFEVIPSGSVFVGTIATDPPLPGSGIRKPISMERLLDSSTSFYTSEKEREENELANIGVQVISNDGKFQDQKSSFFMRVGRHSGAESVTIEGHRDIFIMGKRGEKKHLNHATTLWLTSETRKPVSGNNLQPFGWVRLNRLTDDLSEDFQIKEREWEERKDRKQEMRQAETERQIELKQKVVEEARRRDLEEKQKKEGKEKYKAKLEAMTPEERALAEICNSTVSENRVIEIYNGIDGFSEDNKKAAAHALKRYWKACEKWEKPKGKKTKGILKQIDRVEKVKNILGEK